MYTIILIDSFRNEQSLFRKILTFIDFSSMENCINTLIVYPLLLPSSNTLVILFTGYKPNIGYLSMTRSETNGCLSLFVKS